MADSAFRQVLMLRHIPKAPRAVTTRQLQARLADEGYAINMRSVQRDLERLSTLFPLCTRKETGAHEWYWDAKDLLNIPAMDIATALTFVMVREHLNALLPPSILAMLEAYFQHAEKVLQQHKTAPRAKWRNKVAVLPRGLQLRPAQIDSAVLQQVYEAVFEQRALSILHKNQTKAQTIHPQALVWRNSVTYLLALYWDYDDIRQIALHRIKRAEMLDERWRDAKFSLPAYLQSGAMGIVASGELINLRVKFYGDAGEHLHETPLAKNQTLVAHADHYLVTAQVADTQELRWWLRGFGDLAEVVEPRALRKEMQATAEAALARYR